MRKAPGRGRRAWSLSHVPWSLIDESVPIHRLLFGSSLLLSLEMVEPCLFSPAEPVVCFGFINITEETIRLSNLSAPHQLLVPSTKSFSNHDRALSNTAQRGKSSGTEIAFYKEESI